MQWTHDMADFPGGVGNVAEKGPLGRDQAERPLAKNADFWAYAKLTKSSTESIGLGQVFLHEELAERAGIEPATYGLEGRCSIH